MKNLPQRYNYSSNNTISSFKQAKCCNTCQLENFKKIEWDCVFVWQPARLSACLSIRTDLEPLPLNIKPLIFLKISIISVGTNLCYSDRNPCCATIASPLSINSNWLISLRKIKVLTFNHGIIITHKVLKLQ